ncbi:hypothetical protein HYV11_02935 [Candidatus Dependentiae bacterium]|nr:hypothetical protein [Candidatus Dependentiae bacterium]
MYVFFKSDSLQFLPLYLFVWLSRIGYSWQQAFIFSGITALLLLFLLLRSQPIVDRLILASYCFLIGGAMMFVGNIVFLQMLYGYFKQSILQLWIVVVGLISMLTSTKFIGIDIKDSKKILRYSLYLLIVSFIAFFFSFLFRGSSFAGIIPFIMVKIAQLVLQKKIDVGIFAWLLL